MKYSIHLSHTRLATNLYFGFGLGLACNISIQSECAAIQKMAVELTQVNPFQEISFRRSLPLTHQMGQRFCSHAACPVPVGIIKAVEIEAGLALPKDVSIKLSKG